MSEFHVTNIFCMWVSPRPCYYCCIVKKYPTDSTFAIQISKQQDQLCLEL